MNVSGIRGTATPSSGVASKLARLGSDYYASLYRIHCAVCRYVSTATPVYFFNMSKCSRIDRTTDSGRFKINLYVHWSFTSTYHDGGAQSDGWWQYTWKLIFSRLAIDFPVLLGALTLNQHQYDFSFLNRKFTQTYAYKLIQLYTAKGSKTMLLYTVYTIQWISCIRRIQNPVYGLYSSMDRLYTTSCIRPIKCIQEPVYDEYILIQFVYKSIEILY